MSQTNHTPTPWFIAKKNRFAIDAKSEEGRVSEDYRIAKLHTSPFSPAKEVCEANARLIVAAVNAHDALVFALAELVKLYGHYATLLNQFDGGKRVPFTSAQEWLDRLAELKKIPPVKV